MPSRALSKLARLANAAELPIFPFLAPRAFAPFPRWTSNSSQKRPNSSQVAASTPNTNELHQMGDYNGGLGDDTLSSARSSSYDNEGAHRARQPAGHRSLDESKFKSDKMGGNKIEEMGLYGVLKELMGDVGEMDNFKRPHEVDGLERTRPDEAKPPRESQRQNSEAVTPAWDRAILDLKLRAVELKSLQEYNESKLRQKYSKRIIHRTSDIEEKWRMIEIRKRGLSQLEKWRVEEKRLNLLREWLQQGKAFKPGFVPSRYDNTRRNFHESWIQTYAPIEAEQNPLLKDLRLDFGIVADPAAQSWAAELLEYGCRAGAIRKRWLSMTIEKRGKRWPHIMGFLLRNNTSVAWEVLRGTTGYDDMPPAYAICECLRHIVDDLYDDSSTTGSGIPHEFMAQFKTFWRWNGHARPLLHMMTAMRLILRANDAQARTLANMFLEYASFKQLRAMVLWFSERGNPELAVRALKQLKIRGADLSGADVDQWPVQVACMKLFHSVITKRGYQESASVMQQVMELGVSINVELASFMMDSAVEAGDFSTALGIYNLMVDTKLEVNGFVYSILLKGAKKYAEPDMLRNIIALCMEKAHYLECPRTAAEVLHATYLTLERGQHPDFFDLMLKTYVRYWDEAPLCKLGILPEKGENAVPTWEDMPAIKKLELPVPALAVMLFSYLRHPPQSSSVWDAVRVYTNFRRLASEGHPLISKLASESAMPHHAFLLAFSHSPQTLDSMTTVLTDMLASNPSVGHDSSARIEEATFPKGDLSCGITSSDEGAMKRDPPLHAAPRVETFAIILRAFNRWGKWEASAKVRDIMKRRGIEPNQPTWTTIIHGLCASGKIDEAVAEMREMESKGYVVNEYMLKALGMGRNQELLMRALKNSYSCHVQQ
ncbi:hypothetical protein BDY21DRAFT_331923 [Lineolata rhizophorae]|uniref:Pentacotripeptide-repeat region of PRORP domain-containing protein n=1 Tax=Lineolata rhizophorae TaxID=578093 RepID=A0A6A6PBU7_9PEZI|nr:hypothetical protein BDY21DRAFT_331923 [Lineolata rhizophorae]